SPAARYRATEPCGDSRHAVMATVGPAPDIGNIGADGQASPEKVRGLGVSRGLSTDGAVPGLHPNRVRYVVGPIERSRRLYRGDKSSLVPDSVRLSNDMKRLGFQRWGPGSRRPSIRPRTNARQDCIV